MLHDSNHSDHQTDLTDESIDGRARDILNIIDQRRVARNSFYHGLTAVQIEQLPISTLGPAKIAELEANNECCSVCLDGYDVQTQIRTMRSCNHIFHKECIDNWL